jgi:hypothetical protein
MKIEWNKVTWYSKLIALGLFVVLPFLGFWLGTQYGENIVLPYPDGGAPSASSSNSTLGMSNYYSDTAEWQTDSRIDRGFSIAYPLGFGVDDNYSTAPSMDWRLDANGTPGLKLLTITIPSIFELQTNFADATLTVGLSKDNAAVANCLTSDQGDGPKTATSTTTINGMAFTIFNSTGAGAGNYYQTTSYRTVHAGACYAVEYTIHSSQIVNYPASYNLHPFNQGEVSSVLNRIIGTFKFQ